MWFQRFTERAQKVIYYAQEEAQALEHGYVGTEHILLGLLRGEDGVSKQLLNAQGVEISNVRTLIEEYEGRGDTGFYKSEIPLTPRTKRLLEMSLTEARNLNHNYAAPEHILLALIKESEGVAFTILSNLGVDFDKLAKELIEGLTGAEIKKTTTASNKKASAATPTIDQYGKDLTKLAEEGKLDPVIGREQETQRLLEILCRRIKNNPCLIGDPV